MITVRPAGLGDVAALVRLRTANAERHAGIDPSGYRLPEPDPVRRYFEELLSRPAGDGIVVLVAEVSGAVAGMSEIVMFPAPPEHQMLNSRRLAEVHTVVLEQHRGQGVGKALVAAAEQYAAEHGVCELRAPILAANTEAIGFYAHFGQYGVILRRNLTPQEGGAASA